MIIRFWLYLIFTINVVKSLERCPNGAYIIDRGLSPEEEQYACDEHNRYRKMVTDGVVPNQPQAKYMKTMTYDRVLGEKCKPVSDQCEMKHLPVEDERWPCVGQNIYISWHSSCKTYRNWTAAVESWYEECFFFKYPNISLTGDDVGHYTQLVWADTDTVGCDFISYIDHDRPSEPFCNLYTCNYATCGNFNHRAPYKLMNSSDSSDETCEYDYEYSYYDDYSEAGTGSGSGEPSKEDSSIEDSYCASSESGEPDTSIDKSIDKSKSWNDATGHHHESYHEHNTGYQNSHETAHESHHESFHTSNISNNKPAENPGGLLKSVK